ncbi:regulator of nonsense transcripts UPF3-like [Bidens hawaiensis]|uniref:regulator of nonsense transcripts UPF3-like n=1 Tax=Bidens hawaiensis TaxID=980011 RepID=UPI0040497DA0
MKDRTKVVLRHLPNTISQSAFIHQIDTRFAGRYNWFSFRNSLKSQSYSRAYIDFKRPDDVIEFAEFFNGHVFVNEKGTQFKVIVEYAPSQRVPKQLSKKDGREGTIGKDPQYLEFLEFVSKPVENLPSAEIQLERKEAEQAGAAKEAPIVTPLMDFVRQKRAAKGGPRRSLPNGKLVRRAGASSSSSSSTVVKRGSEKKTSSTMYVLRDSGKSTNGQEKSSFAKRDDRQVSDKSVSLVLDEEKGASATPDSGKKKILLKGKEKEIPHVLTSLLPQQNSSSVKPAARTNQRHEASGRIIRSILVNQETQRNQSDQNQNVNQDRKVRGPLLKDSNGLPDNNNHNNKEVPPDSAEGTRGDAKYVASNEHGVEFKPTGTRSGHFSSDNGTYKHGGRRASAHNNMDTDGSPNFNEGKVLKRGGAGYGSHEKRVWVQKPSSGS